MRSMSEGIHEPIFAEWVAAWGSKSEGMHEPFLSRAQASLPWRRAGHMFASMRTAPQKARRRTGDAECSVGAPVEKGVWYGANVASSVLHAEGDEIGRSRVKGPARQE